MDELLILLALGLWIAAVAYRVLTPGAAPRGACGRYAQASRRADPGGGGTPRPAPPPGPRGGGPGGGTPAPAAGVPVPLLGGRSRAATSGSGVRGHVPAGDAVPAPAGGRVPAATGTAATGARPRGGTPPLTGAGHR